jgi:predicted RNA-binding Zn ribbon-like protein
MAATVATTTTSGRYLRPSRRRLSMTDINVMLVSLSPSSETMDERDKRRVGEQVEPGGRPKAPGLLALLQRFVNTWNHEFPQDWDRLGTPEKARAWLIRTQLIAPDSAVFAAQAARLRRLREAIRELVLSNHGDPPPREAAAVIAREAVGAWLRIDVDPAGTTSMRPRSHGVEGAIALLLGILHEAELTHAWPRLKACRQCGYAFFDRSKNRSATWCDVDLRQPDEEPAV